MTTTLTATVPLIFQLLASRICHVNYDPATSLCWEMTDSGYNKPNLEILDLSEASYMKTVWLDPDTMLTQIKTPQSCQEWLNEDWDQPQICL